MSFPRNILRAPDGTPQPPTEIVVGLRRVDPHLGVKYAGLRWNLTWVWPDNDPRRARIRSQEIPEDAAIDIVGAIPMDCPLEEVPAYAAKSLRDFPRGDIKGLVEKMDRYNQVDVAKEQTEAILDATLGSLGSEVSKGISVVAGMDLKAPKVRKSRQHTPQNPL